MQLGPVQLHVAVKGGVHSFILYSHANATQRVAYGTVGYRKRKKLCRDVVVIKSTAKKKRMKIQEHNCKYNMFTHEITEICREYELRPVSVPWFRFTS
jgi:hypothetical protein